MRHVLSTLTLYRIQAFGRPFSASSKASKPSLNLVRNLALGRVRRITKLTRTFLRRLYGGILCQT